MEPAADVVRGWRRGRTLQIVVWGLVALVACGAFVQGLRLRRWVYEVTEPIHFTSDISRGCYWGLVASGPEGYLNQYDKMEPEQPEWQDSRWSIWLDYAPLRLLVMSRWGAWLRAHDKLPADVPLPAAWQEGYEFTAPVLRFNTAMDVLGAVCAFCLTRLWVRRGSDPTVHPLRGVWQGTAAALLLWFNPAMLLSAYGWPTWDSWIVPMYLLAALLASLDKWFCAGVVLAIGAMFKGQQLAVALIFVLWPLLQWRFGAVLRWSAGLVFGFAAVASPWLVSYLDPAGLATARNAQVILPVVMYPEKLFVIPRLVDVPALMWIAGLILAAGTLPWLARRVAPAVRSGTSWHERILHPRWQMLGLAGLLIMAAVIWPWMLERNHAVAWQGALAGISLAVAAFAFRARQQPYVLAAATAVALLFCMSVFHGSHGWWDCAFHYGTIHWPWLVVGRTSNVPGLLQERFDWPAQDVSVVALTISGLRRIPLFNTDAMDLTLKQVCNGLFIILLVFAGIGVALQSRRNSRRMLAALITPWLLFFCFPVQIHERYLLFGAGAAAICIGESVGLALLGLLLTCATAIMTLHVMLDSGDRGQFGEVLAAQFPSFCTTSAGDTIYQYIRGTFPDIAWGILIITAIFMYLSLSRGSYERTDAATQR